VAEFPQIAAQVPGFEAFAIPQAPGLAGELPPPVAEPIVFDAPATSPSVAAGSHGLLGDDGHVKTMQELEANVIRFAIQRYHGRMTEVSRRLGIGRSTLYRKLKELGIAGEEAE